MPGSRRRAILQKDSPESAPGARASLDQANETERLNHDFSDWEIWESAGAADQIQLIDLIGCGGRI
jgi:hypothetical protein